ncbi:MAG: glycoside hydrolase family 3 protein [Chlorobiaceae bacterium]|nr:glycoside hydrolase family 3 protein [Chlorobiaceae bacterium]
MKRSIIVCCCFFILLFARGDGRALAEPGYRNWQAQQIFSRSTPKIEEALKNMSLSEKVGQMIIAQIEGRYNGSVDKNYVVLDRLVTEGKVGGIMFLKGSAFSAAMLSNHFQSIAPRPLLMSADMERGLAMRLSGATQFPPNMAVAAARDPKLAGAMAEAIAKEARAVGLDQNYAPTVDLNINPMNPIINTRSFGDDVPLTITMSNAIIEGLQSNGVIATVKHFPGHGDVTVDSHISLPVLQADRTKLDNYELKPFKAAIDKGVISVMIGHLAVPNITGTLEPASVSKTIVSGILRQDLGFQGLIITDALNMNALYNGNNLADISVKAVQAGNDLLLFPPDPEVTHDAVMKAVEEGLISESQINASVRRILQVKEWLFANRSRLVDLNRLAEDESPESHKDLAKKIAERSVTLIRDNNNYLPLKAGSTNGNVLNIILQDKKNSETGSEFMKKLDRFYPVTHIRIDPETDAIGYANAADLASKSSAVILTSYVQALSGSGTLKLTEKQQAFIHNLKNFTPNGKPFIFVSLGTPYLINYFPEIPTYLCTYSSNEMSEENAVNAIRGELKPQGLLPVTLQR